MIAGGRVLVDQAPELDSLLPGARRDDLERTLDALPQVERLVLELELPGLDLRVVEDVVDHVQQGVSARVDDLGELALLARELGAQQEVGHADHRVHRRPDLVAHRCQEGALRLRRRLGLLPGALELGDVVVDAEEADVGAVLHERDELQLDVDRRSVFTPAPRDALRTTDSHRLLRDLAPLAAIGVAEDEFIDERPSASSTE